MNSLKFLVCVAVWFSGVLLSESAKKEDGSVLYTGMLTDTISKIVSGYPGEIGVAVIINNMDTVTVNNKSIYPMMSVFKLHQAIAVCNDLTVKGFLLIL